jgi:RsiW-degrading membrane proteinase PrsW (M82 family)
MKIYSSKKKLIFLGKIFLIQGLFWFFIFTGFQLVKAQEEIPLGLPIPSGEQPPVRTTRNIITYTHTLYEFASIIASVLAVVMIIYGGLKYLFSGGANEKVNDAKEIIISAISGLLLLIFANLFLQLILPESVLQIIR